MKTMETSPSVIGFDNPTAVFSENTRVAQKRDNNWELFSQLMAIKSVVGTKKIVLYLADDDRIYLKCLKRSISDMQMENLEIYSYTSGNACVEAISENPMSIPVVFLDYYFDESNNYKNDGLSILKKIRRKFNNAYVILLSSQTNVYVATQSLALGAYDYIVKDADSFNAVNKIIRKIVTTTRNSEQLNLELSRVRRVNIALLIFFVSVFFLAYLF